MSYHSWRTLQPFKLLFLGFRWMLTEMIIELSRIKLWVASNAIPEPDYGSSDYSESEVVANVDAKAPIKHKKGSSIEDEEWFEMQKNKPKEKKTLYYPCDKKSDLYVLQQNFIQHNRGYSSEVKTNDSR